MGKGQRIGKFNILSVNVILFQGNQKTGQNNAASGLFTKNLSDFRTIRETKSAVSRHAQMFMFSERANCFRNLR